MHRFRLIVSFIIIISLPLYGCTNSSSETGDQRVEFTKLNADESPDQQPANQAKQSIVQLEEISSVTAVNSKKHLVIAFEVDHLKRLQLKQTKQKIKKKLEDDISDLKIVVSTDKKIILKLEQLEQEILSKNMAVKELEKKLDKIIKLSEEQT